MTTQELKQQIDKVLGNNIRCLLPSYWWKRLFNQVADRIDEVEQSTSQLIDSKVEEVKMPIVESVDELEKLNVEKGGLAAVEKVGEPVIVNYEDCYISLDYVNDWDKYTIIKGVSEIGEVPSDAEGGFIPLIADKYNFYADTLVVGIEDGKRVYGKYLLGGVSIFTLDEINEYLASGRYRLGGGLLDAVAPYFTLYSDVPQPSLYIKGDSWTRLLKEGDVTGGAGAIIDSELSTTSKNAVQNKVVTAAIEELKNSNDGIISRTVYPTKTIFFGIEKDNEISETEREYNRETFRMATNNVVMLKGDTNSVAPLLELTEESVTFGAFKYQTVIGPEKMLTFASCLIDKDGNVIEEIEIAESEFLIRTIKEKTEIREFYIGDSLTDEQKAWNLETAMMVEEKKCTTIFKITAPIDVLPAGTTIPLSAFVDRTFLYVFSIGVNASYVSITIDSNGNSDITVESVSADAAMSSTSTNAVQNKVITAALNNKADKSDIKTINGVSLLGGGNLQLGDEQTFVYDDTELMEVAKDAKADALEAKALVRFIEKEMDELAERVAELERIIQQQ